MCYIICEHGNLARLLRSKVVLMPKFLGWLHFRRLLLVTSISTLLSSFLSTLNAKLPSTERYFQLQKKYKKAVAQHNQLLEDPETLTRWLNLIWQELRDSNIEPEADFIKVNGFDYDKHHQERDLHLHRVCRPLHRLCQKPQPSSSSRSPEVSTIWGGTS